MSVYSIYKNAFEVLEHGGSSFFLTSIKSSILKFSYNTSMDVTVHEMKLQPESFEAIRAGKKIIESRLYDEKRRLIKIGDVVEFKKNPYLVESVKGEVVALLNYPSFDAMFSDFAAETFGLPTKEELLIQIEAFYPIEEQQKYGVLGIKVRLL